MAEFEEPRTQNKGISSYRIPENNITLNCAGEANGASPPFSCPVKENEFLQAIFYKGGYVKYVCSAKGRELNKKKRRISCDIECADCKKYDWNPRHEASLL